MSAQGQVSPAPVAGRRGQPGLRARWLGVRDSLLMNPAFQRWAARFPLTRLVARRRARELFDLCAGFVYSQVLLACVQLRLFESLADGPRRTASLADDLGLPVEGMDRLLRAAATLRLVEPRGEGRYGLGELGAALLGNPGIGAMIEHHTRLYADLQDPVALLRGQHRDTELSRYWPYATAAQPEGLEDQAVAAYTSLMSASQAFIADDVLDAYSLKPHRHLLDLAGGEGAFVAAAAARWPHLELTLFDLPAVAERARVQLEGRGLGERVAPVGGDLFRAPLPRGADVVSLVRVLHDHDDAAVLTMLGRVREILPRDGVLLIAEPMAGTPGAEPVGEAYFGFYLLAMGSGRPRTPEELEAMLRASGFTAVRELKTRRPLLTRVLIAQP